MSDSQRMAVHIFSREDDSNTVQDHLSDLSAALSLLLSILLIKRVTRPVSKLVGR